MDSDLDAADLRGRPQRSVLDYELGLDSQQPLQHRGRDTRQLHEYHLEPSDPQFHHHFQPEHLHHHHHQLTTRESSPPHHLPDPQFDAHAPATNGRHHDFHAVNPDDFYKSYHGLQNDQGDPPPDSLPMAPSSIPRPTLRSNGDGTTPRYPIVPPNQSLPRPNNIRAASNPADNRAAAAEASSASSGKPSVKDLKKRFDQNGDTVPGARTPARSTAATRIKREGFGSAITPRESASSYAAARSGVETPSGQQGTSSRSQRPKYVPEDQVSSNARSFASRVGKPRSQGGANPNSPYAAAELSPQIAPQPPVSASPPSQPPQGLLFGEILPEQCDTSALGFGIDNVRPRGASASEGSWSHHRSLSAPRVDLPPEPSHRDEPELVGDESQTDARVISNGRGRSLSEVASEKPQSPRDPTGGARSSAATSRNLTPTASRLPISSRKLGTPTDSSSPDNTRPSSPTTLKRQPAHGRASRATTPTSRARTPTSTAKTPTRAAGRLKEAASALPTPDSNSRLQAYIGNPPPKLSPPLRSSRPRQPVSMATTASSRLKAVERSKPPPVSSRSRNPSRAPDPDTHRRKISVGPIDFEQRREHIRLAYSKSLRESQALEARKRAAERRRLELEEAAAAAEAEAKAKADAEAGSEGQIVESPIPTLTSTPAGLEDVPEQSTADQQQTVHDALNIMIPAHTQDGLVRNVPREPEPHSSTLTPTTSQQTDLSPPKPSHGSPALGLPGSFPAFSPPMETDMPPPSAVSTTTETTEFDDEIQDNSPLPPQSPLDPPVTVVKPPSPRAMTPTQQKAEYQYPFEDEPETPERQQTSQHQAQASVGLAPTNYDGFPVIPGAFGDEREAESFITTPIDPRYESTATLMPSKAPEHQPVEDRADTVPFPRIQMADDSDCQSEYDDDDGGVRGSAHRLSYSHDDATDACTEDTDDRGRTDECHSESHFSDQISSRRASSCASGDANLGVDDDHHSHADYTSNTNDLLMPPSRPQRLSHHSQWTDYTVGSPDPSYQEMDSPTQDQEESPTFGHVTIFGSNLVGREPEPAFRHPQQGRPSIDSHESSGYADHARLPDINPGQDLNISYLPPNQNSSSPPYIPSPNYQPPPIPTSAPGSVPASRRTSSGFYEPSQYGSTMMTSGRGSEEVMSQLETPQTIDSTSMGTSDQYFGLASQDSEARADGATEEELTEKERHRLIQRRNVIKELVDTEAVFVRDMNIVEEIYKGTAEACPRLDSKTIKQIFRNSEDIIAFHTVFLSQLKEAVSGIYVMRSDRTVEKEVDGQGKPKTSDPLDRAVSIGSVFQKNIEKMRVAHEGFLRSSDQAAKKLIQIQQDPTVKVWLNECNEVAKELTAAWDLDSLLIKPMQRITKYPNLIITLLQHTPQDHPDREPLTAAKDILETAIIEINKTKKNFELVGQIVGRKRKESDVKGGFARAFGKRVDKLQTTGSRPPEDPEYAKLNERFGDDYLRLQVVLRDVEFYTRQVSTHVREFLQYLSSVELVMRLQPGSYPELESKWVQFNISIRDIEKVALEEHVSVEFLLGFVHISQFVNYECSWPKSGSRSLNHLSTSSKPMGTHH